MQRDNLVSVSIVVSRFWNLSVIHSWLRIWDWHASLLLLRCWHPLAFDLGLSVPLKCRVCSVGLAIRVLSALRRLDESLALRWLSQGAEPQLCCNQSVLFHLDRCFWQCLTPFICAESTYNSLRLYSRRTTIGHQALLGSASVWSNTLAASLHMNSAFGQTLSSAGFDRQELETL